MCSGVKQFDSRSCSRSSMNALMLRCVYVFYDFPSPGVGPVGGGGSGRLADSHAGRAAKCRVIKGEKELQVPSRKLNRSRTLTIIAGCLKVFYCLF